MRWFLVRAPPELCPGEKARCATTTSRSISVRRTGGPGASPSEESTRRDAVRLGARRDSCVATIGPAAVTSGVTRTGSSSLATRRVNPVGPVPSPKGERVLWSSARARPCRGRAAGSPSGLAIRHHAVRCGDGGCRTGSRLLDSTATADCASMLRRTERGRPTRPPNRAVAPASLPIAMIGARAGRIQLSE
jgi:hypothetical protein